MMKYDFCKQKRLFLIKIAASGWQCDCGLAVWLLLDFFVTLIVSLHYP